MGTMVCSNAQNHPGGGAGLRPRKSESVSTSPQHEDGANVIRGRSVIVQPGEGPSFWQPTPANGHAVKRGVGTDGAADLVRVWSLGRPGLATFLATIGRWRRPGEPAPAPFERRHDVVDIERAMGMNDTRA